jgi:hypothetical protein
VRWLARKRHMRLRRLRPPGLRLRPSRSALRRAARFVCPACALRSHDGSAVYTASRSLQCRRWEVGGAAPSCTRTWKAHPLPVNDIAVDASGALLVRGTRACDWHVRAAPARRCARRCCGVKAGGCGRGRRLQGLGLRLTHARVLRLLLPRPPPFRRRRAPRTARRACGTRRAATARTR